MRIQGRTSPIFSQEDLPPTLSVDLVALPQCVSRKVGDHYRKSQAKGMSHLFCSTPGLPKAVVAQGRVPKLAFTPLLGDVCGSNMHSLGKGAKNRTKGRDEVEEMVSDEMWAMGLL